MLGEYRAACFNNFGEFNESDANDILHDWSFNHKQSEAGIGGIYENRWYGIVCRGTRFKIWGHHRQQESRHNPQANECICVSETKQNKVNEYKLSKLNSVDTTVV